MFRRVIQKIKVARFSRHGVELVCIVSREQQKTDAEADDCSSREQYSRRSKSRSGSARRSARGRKNDYDYLNAVQLLGMSRDYHILTVIVCCKAFLVND